MEKAEPSKSKVIIKSSVPSGKYKPSIMNNTKINSLQDNNNKIICDNIMKNLGKTKMNPSNKYSTKLYGGKTPIKISSLNNNTNNKVNNTINNRNLEQNNKESNSEKTKLSSIDNKNPTNNFNIEVKEYITPINNFSKSPLNKISTKKDSNVKLSIHDFEEKKIPNDTSNSNNQNMPKEINSNVSNKVNNDQEKFSNYTLSDKKYLSPICFKESSNKLKEVVNNKHEEVTNTNNNIDSNVNVEEEDEEKIKNLILKKEKILEHKKKVSLKNKNLFYQ